MRKPRAELLNLDVLALSLLCCLLASVVGMLVLGGDGREFKQRIALGKSTAELAGMMGQTTATLDALARKLHQTASARQNQVKISEYEELRKKIKVRENIAQAKEEVSRLAAQWQKVEQEKRDNPPGSSVFGNYHGSYVLIECTKDRAEVTPGGERLGLKPSKDQIEKVVDQIKKAGFVLFVVRPSGWYRNSYDAVHPLITQRLDQLQKDAGQVVGRAVLPLDAKTALDAYLPHTKIEP